MSETLTPDQYTEVVYRELQIWSTETRLRLVKAIKKRQAHIPRETIDQLHMQIMRESAGDVFKIITSFPTPARFQDMRKLTWDRVPYSPEIQYLYDWVMSKGVSTFHHVPGYKDSSRISDDEKAMRIANSIRFQRPDLSYYRPKGKWFNSDFFKSKEYLRNRIRFLYSKYVAGAVAELTVDSLTLS